MKIKSGFVKQKVHDKWLAVATGERTREFHGMIELNETAALIWDALEDGKTPAEIAATVADTYDIPLEKAADDVNGLLRQMADSGLLDE